MSSNKVEITGSAYAGEDAGLEISLKREKSRGKKRWILLKNVMRGARRTSLTKPEQDLLGAIDAGKKSSSSEDDEKLMNARKELKEEITLKKQFLTGSEAAFLTSLADADVSSDYLEQTKNVLTKDKLYVTAKEEEDGDGVPLSDPGTAAGANTKEKIEKANNDNFRTELWRSKQCSTSNEEKEYEDTKPEKVEEESRSLFDKKKKTKSPVVFSYFSSMFSTETTTKEEDDKDTQQDQKENEAESSNEIAFAILGTSVDDEYAKPHVLSPPLMDSLRPHMPYAIREDNYWLKYSLVRDGSSMEVLLSKVRSSTRTVLAIETMDGEVFGAFTSAPWRRNGNNYYGTGESFLWRLQKPRNTPCETILDQAKLESDVEIFKWSGANRNVQLSNFKRIIVGGGEPEEKTPEDEKKEFSFGLAVNSDLSSGTSGMCVTFQSPALHQTPSDVFEILNLELWTMTPFTNEEEAEKLELGRQFVFDHGMVAH
mmetsp:Transcript_32940/g.48325  ORF Transcript_32940/g.48325 Transcript_32940/m.48325 type:complete len:484 (-) Transcript_32940:83-1534(-)